MLYAKEVYLNETNGSRFGDSGEKPYETHCATVGELYRASRDEYGRCVGKVYIDGAGKATQVGWVFQKRMQYDDCNDTYLREVWVTAYEAVEPVEGEEHLPSWQRSRPQFRYADFK